MARFFALSSHWARQTRLCSKLLAWMPGYSTKQLAAGPRGEADHDARAIGRECSSPYLERPIQEFAASVLAVKVVDEVAVFENGSFPRSELWKRAQADVRKGIARVVWPPRAKQFTIRPVDKGNGVKPIKAACVAHLES